MPATQQFIDRFARQHGPCCAGCDWWRWYNSVAGECIRSAPVSGPDRLALFGITGLSLNPGPGHILTPRDHMCGEYQDQAV